MNPCLYTVLYTVLSKPVWIRRLVSSTSDSFDPLTPDSEVAYDCAESANDEPQTQGYEKNGKREDEEGRRTAPLVGLNGGPCRTTQQDDSYGYL